MITNLIAALLATSAPAQASSTPPAARSLQTDFDAATQAVDAERFDEGVKSFEMLEQIPAVRRNPVTLGTILMRKGIGLIALGRLPEAEAALRAGLNWRQPTGRSSVATVSWRNMPWAASPSCN